MSAGVGDRTDQQRGCSPEEGDALASGVAAHCAVAVLPKTGGDLRDVVSHRAAVNDRTQLLAAEVGAGAATARRRTAAAGGTARSADGGGACRRYHYYLRYRCCCRRLPLPLLVHHRTGAAAFSVAPPSRPTNRPVHLSKNTSNFGSCEWIELVRARRRKCRVRGQYTSAWFYRS